MRAFRDCISPRQARFHNGQKGIIGIGQRFFHGLSALMNPSKPWAMGVELAVIRLDYKLGQISIDPIYHSDTSLQFLLQLIPGVCDAYFTLTVLWYQINSLPGIVSDISMRATYGRTARVASRE